MVQPSTGEAFDRAGLSTATLAPPESSPPPPAASRAGGFGRAAERIFLWLPNDRSPGVAAVLLYLVRQGVLPLLLLFGPIFVWELFAPSKFDPLRHMSTAPSWGTQNWVGAMEFALCIGAFILVQELSRYAFVRHAERPARALIIFTAVVSAFIVLIDHSRLYTTIWMLCAQLAASAVLFRALRHKSFITAIVLAIIVGHTAVYLVAPQFFQPPQAVAPRPVPASAAPAPSSMQPWARLYPSASVSSSKVTTTLGLTSWRVDYRVQASPEQIQIYYRDLADKQGFTDKTTMAGLTTFTQPSTNNDFSIFIVSDPKGAEVIFQARTFGEGGSPR